MTVEREEFHTGHRPVMFNDDMSAKIGSGFVGNSFDYLTGIDAKNFVVWNKSRLVTGKIFTGGAIGKDDPRGLAG